MAALVPIVIPRGRTAAEKRLGAVAALHQPLTRHNQLVVNGMDLSTTDVYCGECSNRFDKVAWPCTTARLLGPWPGESDE